MIRLEAWKLVGLLFVFSCATEPDPQPSLAHVVAGTVSDSLGVPIREVPIEVVLWRQGDTASWGFGRSDGAGMFLTEWMIGVAHHYDSLVLNSFGSLSLAITPCRPYSSVRVTLTRDHLQYLPRDSVHVPIRLGLERPAPVLAAGLQVCAVGFSPFGEEFISQFLLRLAIETVNPAPDSVRGEWEIFFQETRSNLKGSFAGLVSGSTLDLALHMAPDNYVECEPGYRLRIVLEQAQHLGPGDLETLRPDVLVCPIEQLDPLRFVAFEPPLNAIGAKD
jgi:hypothetical protein